MGTKRVIGKLFAYTVAAALALSASNPLCSQAARKSPKLSAKKLTLAVNEKAKLKVCNVGKKQIVKAQFTSNKKKVAKVNASGVVTAVKPGNAKITCKLVLKNRQKYQLKCTVTVKKKQKTPEGGEQATASPVPNDNSLPAQTQPSGSGQPQATLLPEGSNLPGTPVPVETSAPADTSAPEESGQPVKATSIPEMPPAPIHLSANGVETIDNGIMRSGVSAMGIIHAMGLGINLGNTMESCGSWINGSSVSSYETAWGAPITTQEIISGMKKSGFDSIRIPVAWSNMMSEDGSYTINEDYLNRVETIMNYAFNERMYVVLNIHYDGGWWARFGSQDADERVEAMKKYKAIWTQIAERYKEYSDYLIFESANEEVGSRLNSTGDYANSGYYTNEDDIYALANTINQTFVDIVRESGGNNSMRHLLIAGYNTDIGKTCDDRFKMPTDTIEDHLAISIHCYSPATYCLADSEENSWGYRASWGTDEDIAGLKSELSDMKICFVNKGYPVIIGEYGVADAKQPDGTWAKKEGRDLYFKSVCEYALNNGMCPVLWHTGGVYSRTSYKITDEAEAAIYLELKEAHGNTSPFEPPAGNSSFSWSGTVGCSGWNPTSPVAEDEGDFIVTGQGGCYKMSGIDWSKLEHPVLTFHTDSLTGSTGYVVATRANVNTENQYWSWIEESAEKQGNWNFSSDLSVDLSDMGLSDREAIYICFRTGTDFRGKVTLTVSSQ